MNNTEVGRLLRAVARTARTRYPAFLFGLPLARGEIPVFTYHDVEAASLARDLDFLEHNGYRTLGLDEYLAARDRKHQRGRAVLLTFDDARRSFWDVALPLLRARAARAVLFAPSYWMQPQHAAHFMTWQQLRACLDCGLIDVQSHAHRHALAAVAPRLVDFASPQALARFDFYDWPMRHLGAAEELGQPALGTPVYHAAPLLSVRRCYRENAELTLACRQFVQQRGGCGFFTEPRWRERLQALHRRHRAQLRGRYLSAAQLHELIASEFQLSRECFRAQLGYTPTCIAYPWMLGSPLSMELARRSGYRMAFGVALDYRAERRSAALPLPVRGRLKCDWLQHLPGAGRAGVWGTIGRKLRGLGTLQHLAH